MSRNVGVSDSRMIVMLSSYSPIDTTSYSPGLLRPVLGTRTQLKKVVMTAHKLGIPVIVDLNWESFTRRSLVSAYHSFYNECRRKKKLLEII